jgi:small-conductance mechanosensitive channel
LEKTSDLIKEILKNDPRIHQQPIPRVLPLEFGDSRIDLEIAFWVTHYLEVPFVKGDIINQVDVMFKKQGIVIPFPQRDIHFRSSFEIQKGDLEEDANTGSDEKH